MNRIKKNHLLKYILIFQIKNNYLEKSLAGYNKKWFSLSIFTSIDKDLNLQ